MKSNWIKTSYRGIVRFSFLQKPQQFNEKSEPKFSIALELFDDLAVKKAQEFLKHNGITAKAIKTHKDTGEKYIVFDSNALNQDGTQRQLLLTDASGNPETGLIPASHYIAKGAEVIVHLITREKKDGSAGRVMFLAGVQALSGITEKGQNIGFDSVQGQTLDDLNALNEEGTRAVFSYGDR